MYDFQNKKTYAWATALSAGATGTFQIDTLNYDAVSIDVVLGVNITTAFTQPPTVIQLYQSDVTNATTFTSNPFTANGEVSVTTSYQSAITGVTQALTNYTSVSNVSQPTVSNDVVTIDAALNIGNMRYLQVSVSPNSNVTNATNPQPISVIANLYRGEQAPATATAKNVQAWVVI